MLQDLSGSSAKDTGQGLLANVISQHVAGSCDRIEVIAATMRATREGFSRRFAREVGMSPHAFRIVARLNRGRCLLRSGESVFAAAVDTGFADHSYFGRTFRRTFGATPAAYSRV